MKPGYYLSVDLISKRKFPSEDLKKIENSLELNEDFFDICSILSGFITMNFSNHVEIYSDDIGFEADKLSEVEDFIEIVDSLIPGGWDNDSKIEWSSDYPDISYVWFKNGDLWELVTKEHDRGIWGEEEEWDNNDKSSNYSSDIDPDDFW